MIFMLDEIVERTKERIELEKSIISFKNLFVLGDTAGISAYKRVEGT